MTNIYSIHGIIVPAQSPVFSAHTYTEIYGGSVGCSIVVNGIPLTIGGSSSLNVAIRKVSGGTGCFLLGQNNDVIQGSTRL